MEIKKDQTLLVIIIGTLIILSGLLIMINVQKELDDPGTCHLCHEMRPFVASYLDPEQGSAILMHRLTCIECHTNTSLIEAKEAVIKEIEKGIISKIAGTNFKTSSPALAVNCKRCHFIFDISHPNSTFDTNCQDCHWAHEKPDVNLIGINTTNKSMVLYGFHTGQTCQNCHGTTFQIPRCINCHDGHGEQKLENRLCLMCHKDPHIPVIPDTTINITGDLPFSVCMPCHENQYFSITNIYSYHTEMQTCTKCHNTHGERPQCRKCHPGMMLDRHNNFVCEDCHLSFPTKVTCMDCHGKEHEWSSFTAMLNPK